MECILTLIIVEETDYERRQIMLQFMLGAGGGGRGRDKQPLE